MYCAYLVVGVRRLIKLMEVSTVSVSNRNTGCISSKLEKSYVRLVQYNIQMFETMDTIESHAKRGGCR